MMAQSMVNEPMDMAACRVILAAAQWVDRADMSFLPVLRNVLAATLLALMFGAQPALA
jgi:hypothetical protein